MRKQFLDKTNDLATCKTDGNLNPSMCQKLWDNYIKVRRPNNPQVLVPHEQTRDDWNISLSTQANQEYLWISIAWANINKSIVKIWYCWCNRSLSQKLNFQSSNSANQAINTNYLSTIKVVIKTNISHNHKCSWVSYIESWR